MSLADIREFTPAESDAFDRGVSHGLTLTAERDGELVSEISRLRAENERLREALEDVIRHCEDGEPLPVMIEKQARAALTRTQGKE